MQTVPVTGLTGPGTQTGFPKLCISGVSKTKNKFVVRGGVPVVAVGQAVPLSGPTGPGTQKGFQNHAFPGFPKLNTGLVS